VKKQPTAPKACSGTHKAATNEPAITRHLLSAPALLKIPRAQFRRHLEKSKFAAPVVFNRRAVRD
jgi:hypothetical protein